MAENRDEITEFFKNLQDNISNGIAQLDGKAVFEEDIWERKDGGGGRTRIIQNGDAFEKGGVNFSAVHGALPAVIKNALKVNGDEFYATGVSIVIHPNNPFVPIIHMNVRYFEIEKETYWFGGGIDLTPHYIIEKDAQFFHDSLKKACDKNDVAYYPEFKKWADDYFFIKHRNETRGIGGIFFDRLNTKDGFTKSQRFKFVKDVGNSFLPIYTELVNRNRATPFNDNNKEWQFVRRGRYVEFNLVYDKGTKFGLDTNGRIESILMSLPKTAQWHYNYQVNEGSEEEFTLENLKKGKAW